LDAQDLLNYKHESLAHHSDDEVEEIRPKKPAEIKLVEVSPIPI